MGGAGGCAVSLLPVVPWVQLPLWARLMLLALFHNISLPAVAVCTSPLDREGVLSFRLMPSKQHPERIKLPYRNKNPDSFGGLSASRDAFSLPQFFLCHRDQFGRAAEAAR